jgi:hypothetical protein
VQAATVPLPPFPPGAPDLPPGFGEAVPPGFDGADSTGFAEFVALDRPEGLVASEPPAVSDRHAVDPSRAATTAAPTA